MSDKEYYNQKISELYAVIENQEKIIRELQENYNNELDENLKMSELWLKSKERIDKAIEYINKFEDIKAYYSYEENGYEEYNYDEDFKIDLLEILKGKE